MKKNHSITSSRFILSLNLGSSSLKFALYDQEHLHMRWSGEIKGIGAQQGSLKITDSLHSSAKVLGGHFRNVEDAALAVMHWLKENKKHIQLSGIGYRLVHGGPEYIFAEPISVKMIDDLKKIVYLSPNHLPYELELIALFQQEFPSILHIGVFDTFFHKDIPDHNRYFALPRRFTNLGLRKYGFHGISCEYIMDKLGAEDAFIKEKKIIIAHLGSGASVTAILNGKSIENTMGISPIGGLVMGTRSGDLDPGAILFMLKSSDITPEELEVLLSEESGMKAIAGTSDFSALLPLAHKDERAALALHIFCQQVKKFIAALAAGMGGLDILVFTGGIAEHSPQIRERICQQMEFIGLKVDAAINKRSGNVISHKQSKVKVCLFKTCEEKIIAMHVKSFYPEIKSP